jgi:GDP-4-dehydro-6-deoxy-D-mannose reductase
VIFGAEGFIGGYLTDHLVRKGYRTTSVFYRPLPKGGRNPNAEYKGPIDVSQPEKVMEVLRRTKPGLVYHLAAVSLPTESWKDPWSTLRINVRGTLNVLDAVRQLGTDSRVFVACSSAEYGLGHRPGTPTLEDAPLLPLHAYGVSKVAQDLLAHQYFQNYRVKTIRARIFNTIGPGKTGEVTSDFARQIVSIERKKAKPVLHVGNLSPVRDFTDVRDMVRAMELVLRLGKPGEVYNLASGRSYSVQSVLDTLLGLSTTKIRWQVDKALLRPTDEPYIVGNPGRLRRATRWSPRYDLPQTLTDILDYFRGA